MEAKQKLNAALNLVRPDLREEFLKDLVLRMYSSLMAAHAQVGDTPSREYAECVVQALESVDVSRVQAVQGVR